jgi:PmbA protein
MEELLQRAAKVSEQAELFKVVSEETPVQFEANRLKHIQSKQSASLALRLIKDGRIGYAATAGVDDSQELINMALETARFGQPAGFDLPQGVTYPSVDIYDENTKEVPLEKMVEMGKALIAIVRDYNPDIVCEVQINKAVMTVTILNSHGVRASYRKSVFSLAIEGSLIRGTDMLFVGDGDASSHPILAVEDIGKLVLTQLERAENVAQAPTKTLPVIFTPQGVSSALVPALAAAFNGKIVLEGASPVGNKLGEAVFDKRFDLADDTTIAYRPGSRPFDDEGIPSRRTSLISDGVVANFYYDLKTAAKAGKKSTGNGSRGRGQPGPSLGALVIRPGETGFEDMVADIKEGLVVEYLMGAEQGNVLSGDFSGNVLLGYKIENGKIVGRVKNTVVSGNIHKALKQVAAIGIDARWVGSSLYAPSIYLPGLTVAAK